MGKAKETFILHFDHISLITFYKQSKKISYISYNVLVLVHYKVVGNQG